jgi:4-hydroxy-tetrahydrodipicolinate reductase
MKVGYFGFGKTGREAVYPFLCDTKTDLKWVLKNSDDYRGMYASKIHYFDFEKGLICSEKDWSDNFLKQNKVDVIVDFSKNTNINKYQLLAENNVKIVSAISKYSDDEAEQLKQIAKKTAVIWSPNITIGVNLLILASRFIQSITPEADIQIIESHFRDKKEKSGTALKIADTLKVDYSNVHSIRAGGILGKHEIIFGYPFQTITLSHDAISRRAFGRGALACAKWIVTKENGLYNMSDMLTENLKEWINHQF